MLTPHVLSEGCLEWCILLVSGLCLCFELVCWCLCFVLVLYYIIISYTYIILLSYIYYYYILYIYYYYILYYTLLSSILFFSFLPSSIPLPLSQYSFYTCRELHLLIYTLQIYSSSPSFLPLSSFPSLLFLPHLFSYSLPNQQSDPACFIGVDG